MRHNGEELRFRPVSRRKRRSALLELLLELRVQSAGLLLGTRARADVAKNPPQADEVPMAVVHGSYGARRFERVRPSLPDPQRPFAVAATGLFSRCYASKHETECPPLRTTDEACHRRSDQSLASDVKEVHRGDIRLANEPLGVAHDVGVGRAVEELLVVPKRNLETVCVDQLVILRAFSLFAAERGRGRRIVAHPSLANPATFAFNTSIHRVALSIRPLHTGVTIRGSPFTREAATPLDLSLDARCRT